MREDWTFEQWKANPQPSVTIDAIGWLAAVQRHDLHEEWHRLVRRLKYGPWPDVWWAFKGYKAHRCAPPIGCYQAYGWTRRRAFYALWDDMQKRGWS